MSVCNSIHKSEHGDDYIEDPDPVTLISKLDISDPLHLHPNDSTTLTVISIKLKGTKNYQVWSCDMLLALEELKETYDKVDGSRIFGLHHQIHTVKQNGSSIANYYHKLNAPWKQFDAMVELPKCICNDSESFKKHNQLMKLMQLLMGLDDSYMQIRSSILSREVLPDVRSAYATISSEESHRVASGANQHMTYTDKELDNVLDISHLKIKVGHPNGTEDFISKIGYLKLSNGLVLYDVLVILEYCVTLISVQKLVKENKIIVAFDKSGCYFFQLGFEYEKYSGDSLGHHAEPVLNDSVIGKNDTTNVFQDINHINFFDGEHPKMPNDDERVDHNLNSDNKSQSDSSHSSVSGESVNTANFPKNSRNDADSSEDIFATQNEKVTTLEDNIFSKGNLDQNPSISTQDT
ncbi:hypothetical protein Tco_0828865 [Tanacetum coccineum]